MNCKDCHDRRDFCLCEDIMKIKFEFDDHEKEQAQDAFNGTQYKETLNEIWEKLFRPNNKHGYGDEILDAEHAYLVIERLAEKYSDIIDGINL